MLFLFNKDGSGFLANCSLCGTEATLSFLASPECSSFSAEAWAILQALRWSQQHQKVCLFSSSPLRLSLFSCHCVLLSIFPFTSNYLKNLRETVFPFLLYYNESPDIHFSWATMRLMSLADKQHYSCPLQFLVVFLILPLVSTLVFSGIGGELSHLNSLTPNSPRLPMRNLCSLITLAVPFLVSLQWTQPSVKLLSH